MKETLRILHIFVTRFHITSKNFSGELFIFKSILNFNLITFFFNFEI